MRTNCKEALDLLAKIRVYGSSPCKAGQFISAGFDCGHSFERNSVPLDLIHSSRWC